MRNCNNCKHSHRVDEDQLIVDDGGCDDCRIIHEEDGAWYTNWEPDTEEERDRE